MSYMDTRMRINYKIIQQSTDLPLMVLLNIKAYNPIRKENKYICCKRLP